MLQEVRDHNKQTGLGVDDMKTYQYADDMKELLEEKLIDPVITASAGR